MLPLSDENPTYHTAYVTIALIIINIGVFAFVQQRPGPDTVTLPDGRQAGIDAEFKFTFEHAAIPCELTQSRPLDLSEIQDVARGSRRTCDKTDGPQLFPDKSIWFSALASLFMHGSWFHLGFNMLFLWIFGNNIEDHVGGLKYLIFYALSGVVALASHVAAQPDSSVPVLGASGAVAGVMGAYLLWFPRAPIRTLALIFLLRVRAIWWLLVWFVLQFFTWQNSGTAWVAHVGGFVFGAFVAAIIRHSRPLRRRVWREPWRKHAYYRWDLSGGMGEHEPPRFGRRTW